MLIKLPIFACLALLAFAGTTRIGLFTLNRGVFGQKSDKFDRMKWLMVAIPPLLILLTLLFYPLCVAIQDGFWTPWATGGAIWLLLSCATGAYWIVDRVYQNLRDSHVPGTKTFPSEITLLRKAHIPIRALRELGAHNDLYDLEITTHAVFIPDLPEAFEGYRIAFLTDTHVASFMRRAYFRECVDQVNKRSVDLILLGGDFVTWKRHIPLMSELLIAPLRAKDGCFAVLGNHDYWADADGVIAALTSRGVRFIVNRAVTLERNGAAIDLVGIDEVYRGRPDVPAAFSSVTNDRPCLGLSHHPDIIGLLHGRRIDLLLCGHTHGGQIRVPFFGALVVPSRHEARYAAGFIRVRDVLMYVSRGLGAVPPIRILCRPEIPVFVLRRGEKQ
ncbi:MAG TPA: metallophosphoesterase [Thermoanaerobaculia bacterium]|nr:metallophosphoesterase [Thermoanaerobaculia bacterium]